MIECVSCRTCIDVSDDDAYDLGWQYETDYVADEYDRNPTLVETFWYCPHCVHMEKD